MMTDRQLFATLKAESKAKTPVTSSSIRETTPYIAGVLDALNAPSAPLSMDLVYNLDRMAFGFSVERLGKGDYQITPVLSFKYAPPAGEAPFGKDFLTPSVINVSNDTTMTRELGLCTVRERGKKFSPFVEDSVGTVVKELKKEGKSEHLDPTHGGLSGDYLSHNAGLTMQALLDEVASYIGLQMKLPSINCKDIELMSALDLANHVKGTAVDALAPLVCRAMGRSDCLNAVKLELSKLLHNEYIYSSSATPLVPMCESLVSENWGRKKSEKWRVKPDKGDFKNIGDALSSIASTKGPVPEKGVMKVVKELCVVRSLYGDREYSMESTAPCKSDGTPLWPSRMTFPVSLRGVQVDWVSPPSRNGNKFSPRFSQWEVAMILTCDSTGASTILTEVPPPAPTEETTPAPTEETTPAPTEETTPAPTEETTPAPTEETTSATSNPEGDKPSSSFPSMKDWKDVLTIKIH